MSAHHGHQGGAIGVGELLKRQVRVYRPGIADAPPPGRPTSHARPDLAQRTPGSVVPPDERFFVQRNPALLTRVLAGLRRLA
ncbi:hypothetical protein AB0A63_12755 [Lentzea sp. NPDC042327]|uniref:hypothetical protein n=1 Tax=Lentzea sp. NPDC042327 TaxID=3154801 RepID=UPI0033D9F163